MKLILSGYSGSKQILGASSWLVAKYLGDAFEVFWLNYGVYDGPLFVGEYVSLADQQKSPKDWAHDIRQYLMTLDDRLIIFALDDYLLSGPLNKSGYRDLVSTMGHGIICARLCQSDFYKPHEHERCGYLIQLTATAEYSATTQYCIWDRPALIDLLGRVTTPWAFEVEGSKILNKSGKKVIGRLKATLPYNEHSCLSSRWPGKINIKGSLNEDIDELVEKGLLNSDDLFRRE